MAPFHIAFDIGHSSIGWAVLKGHTPDAFTVEGTGIVLFLSNTCLTKKRRVFRRQRRNVISLRKRVARIADFIEERKWLTRAELESVPHAWPWLDAARVLQGNKHLSWLELWNVLRWYAHNRGYDGNRLWSSHIASQDSDDDTKREKAAKNLMRKYGTTSRAETLCAYLGVAPEANTLTGPNLKAYFKGERVAFPRDVVVEEVRKILTAHKGILPGCNDRFIQGILEDWHALQSEAISLPKRYKGGLLFGQYIPRFDNRIIPICPISLKKTPNKNTPEYLQFRWAMLLANLRIEDPLCKERPLSVKEKAQVTEKIKTQGAFTKKQLKDCLKQLTGQNCEQIDRFFVTKEMEKTILLDPVMKKIQGTPLHKALFKQAIPEAWHHVIINKLRRKPCSLKEWRSFLENKNVDLAQFDTIVQEDYEKKNKKTPQSYEDFLKEPITLSNALQGRAPYSREIMRQAVKEIMEEGKDPRAEGGVLYMNQEDIKRRLGTPIDTLTNNHLVRHRLKLFVQLLEDIVEHYADNDPRMIESVTVEVIRDIQQFSGMTNKEIARELNKKLSHHRDAVALIEKQIKDADLSVSITAGLIRKVRIAQDLGWRCPYTKVEYSLVDIIEGRLEIEHIIPYSLKPSNSLEALVLTYREVNTFKGNRTGLEFIMQEDSKPVPGDSRLSIMSHEHYKDFVDRLPVKSGSNDDQKRRAQRKSNLLTLHYNPRETEFQARDLTVTSHINKLAVLKAQDWLSRHEQNNNQEPCATPKVHVIPGRVTGLLRMGWHLTDCIGSVCPKVVTASGEILNKGDIRKITHLHHAIDAITLAIAGMMKQRCSDIAQLLEPRSPDQHQQEKLKKLNLFEFDASGRAHLIKLPEALRKSIEKALEEKRVVMHVPKTMRGLKTEQNTWGVVGINEKKGHIKLRQRSPRDENNQRPYKYPEENPLRLLGYEPRGGDGKLKRIKGVIVVDQNFGVALDPEPVVIPHFHVYPRLRELQEKNGGRWPRIIRNGMLIEVPQGRYQGRWRVASIKNAAKGIQLDLAHPERCTFDKGNVAIKTLIEDKMHILKPSLTGHIQP